MVEGRDRTPKDCNYSFSFHISDLNMNEWVLVKGRMKVVPSNLMSMGSLVLVRYQDLGVRRRKTEIPRVDRCSTGPPEIGTSHK